MEQVKQKTLTPETFLNRLQGVETFEKVSIQHVAEHTEEIDANPALLEAKIECEYRNIMRYGQRIAECQRRIEFYEQTLRGIQSKGDAYA